MTQHLLFSFAPPGDIHDDFVFAAFSTTLTLALITGVVLMFAHDIRPRLARRKVLWVAAVAWGVALMWSHSSSYGRFSAVQLHDHGLRIQYAGEPEVFVPSEELADIRFGAPGRSDRPCYITITTRTGTQHRSATVAEPVSYCSAIRTSLLRLNAPR